MKRIPALQPLSMEHHLSLSLAVKAMRVARGDDEIARRALCAQIVEDYGKQWRPHFDAEERCLFQPCRSLDPEIARHCDQLTGEHRQFDAWVEQMRQGDCSVLEAFGALLQTHTRMEERSLFPLLQVRLNKSQQQALLRCLESYLSEAHQNRE